MTSLPGAARPARRWRQALNHAGWLALLATVVVLLLADPPWLRTLRHAVFDQYQRWQPRTWQDTAVRVIDVDEESLARIGQWPWPRTRMADLVDQAHRGDAAAIGFDVVFAEPDRTSPATAARHWQLSAQQRAAVDAMPDHDSVFAQAMQGRNVVLGFALRGGPAPALAPATDAAEPDNLARIVGIGHPAAPFLRPFGGTVSATPLLTAHAGGQGALAFLPDSDGVVRRVPMLVRVGEQLLPSLATEMLRVGQRQDNVLVRSADDGVQALRVGQLTIPTTQSGEVWVHYTPPVPTRTISAWRLLEGQVPASELQGKLLLMGSSAQGLLDLRFGTLGQLVPGVEIHAQVLEQILTGGLLARPSWAHGVEALALAVGALLVGALALTIRPALASAAACAVLAALCAGSWWAFTEQRLLLDPLTPALGVGIAFLGPSLVRHHTSEQRRRWVAQAFSRYVSPNLVSHIVRNPAQLTLGGQRQDCTFIFTDLAGFTALMERIDPGQAVGLLNDYLDGMIAIAFRHQGTLDRIVGDSIAIMFSAPVVQADHRERAVACALELQRFGTAFAQAQHALGVPFGHTRIGVHGGEVIVGNFGGKTIFDYRALGDPVNTASRLESCNKHLGTRLCISEDVVTACPDLPVRRVGRLVFQGKTRALTVFQPVHDGLDLPVDRPALQRYEQAYQLMASQHDGALAAFEALALHTPDEPLVRLHLDRLRRGEQGDLIRLADK